jgi:hypothetical protein
MGKDLKRQKRSAPQGGEPWGALDPQSLKKYRFSNSFFKTMTLGFYHENKDISIRYKIFYYILFKKYLR